MERKKKNYVDNAAFLEALKVHAAGVKAAAEAGTEPPLVSEFIGECLLKIATHLSYKANFVNYTYREDMVSDGVENCLTYVNNFDPEKSKNPFGYFTTVMAFAFIRRIQREKKHTYIKYRMLEKALTENSAEFNMPTDTSMLTFDNVTEFIRGFEEYVTKRRDKRKKTKEEREMVS